MSKIWFFGDCFTWGFGCRPSFSYCKKYRQPEDKLWTEIVSSTLGIPAIDKSIALKATNFSVIKEFIENLSYIRKGDIVVYGTSKPLGLLKLNKDKDSIESLATYNIEWDRHWNDDEDKQIGLDYINRNVRGYDKEWMSFFLPQIKSLALLLLERGVKTYIWSYELYDKLDRFESIEQATNGEIEDYHFSFNGHRQMADYILNKINKEDYFKKSLV